MKKADSDFGKRFISLSESQRKVLLDFGSVPGASSYKILETLVAFTQAYNTYVKMLEKTVRVAGLTVSQFVTLWALLLSDRSMMPTEIARLLPIEPNSVSPLLDRLQERKLIRRRRSRNDKRSVGVSLTVPGEQLIKEVLPRVRDLNAQVFETLSSREQNVLGRLARKIRDTSVRLLGASPDHAEAALIQVVGKTRNSPSPSRGKHGEFGKSLPREAK